MILPASVRFSTLAMPSIAPAMPLIASTEAFVSKPSRSTFRSTIRMSSIVEPLVPNMKQRFSM